MVWILIWMQLISGNPVDHFVLGHYETKVECSKSKELAKVMISHNGIAITCLGIKTE
tara:strand:+ start:104 stop:274 length:171 start_codon:yes stop_codon:yes gene_type:complete